MPCYKVKVKWGKETFPDIEANTDESPVLFKAQLFALTGVQPDRQKVMLKGVTLKDADWANFKLRDGTTVLLMGSKDDLPKEPVEKTTFVEDMNESELATALDLPPGLHNINNTCYLNATIQCLRTVPELRDSLKGFKGDIQREDETLLPQSITAALRDVYSNMDQGFTIPPFTLLQMLHRAFPRFGELSGQGGFQQQDANECWTELVRVLQQKLPAKEELKKEQVDKYKSLIDQFFGGTFDVEWKCVEAEDEPPNKTKEQFLQMSCFIAPDVTYMHSGLRSKMQEQITKMSSSLGRDAVYTKTSQISRLPAYLTIQFVRFYYKEKKSINAKILKDIKFPLDFDAYELCCPELQEKLAPMRLKFKELEDAQVEASSKGNGKSIGDTEKKPKGTVVPYWFENDLGSNNSGYYTLQAVLTHKGRSSTSGHYVGWIRQSENKWFKCDDDTVSPVTTEEILKLSGGGDWHCAYVLLYGPRILEIPEANSDQKMAEDPAL